MESKLIQEITNLFKNLLKQLRTDILNIVRGAMRDVSEEQNEVWISGKQLAEQFSMFGKDWQVEYGHLLPRTRCQIEKNGELKIGKWAYARNKIQRMIATNEIKNLKYKVKDEDQSRN